MNSGKTASNPKLNIIEHGKSIRTKKKKPIETRIGRDNGRSYKIIRTYKGNRIDLRSDKMDVNVDRINRTEIQSALYPDNKFMCKTAHCRYRMRHSEDKYVTMINCHRMLDARRANIDARRDNIDSIANPLDSDILVESLYTLSPSNNDLIVITSYHDKLTGKSLGSDVEKINIKRKNNARLDDHQ